MKSESSKSPDFNVLNLGFFNSIQSLQHQTSPNNIDELIEINIEINNFDNISPEILNNTSIFTIFSYTGSNEEFLIILSSRI